MHFILLKVYASKKLRKDLKKKKECWQLTLRWEDYRTVSNSSIRVFINGGGRQESQRAWKMALRLALRMGGGMRAQTRECGSLWERPETDSIPKPPERKTALPMSCSWPGEPYLDSWLSELGGSCEGSVGAAPGDKQKVQKRSGVRPPSKGPLWG